MGPRTLKNITENPFPGESVVVAVRVEGDQSRVIDAVDDFGGEVTNELPFDTLQIELPQRALKEFSELDDVGTMNVDRELEVADQGN